MKPLLLFALFLLTPFLSISSLRASSLVEEGFADFRARGSEAAIKTWSRGSTDPARLESLAKFQELITMEKKLGACLGHDTRIQNHLGSGSTLYLISARFEKGALFFQILTFTDSLNRSSLQIFRWSTDPTEVWPGRILYPGPAHTTIP